MPNLIDLIRWEGQLFLVALGIVVLAGVVTGIIRARGLLDGITSDGRRFASTGRTQLLIATVVVGATYVSRCLSHPGELPGISKPMLLLFGGSHIVYLGSKLSVLRKKHSIPERRM
jgi:hypothetical protein